jgi:hypothetical protein
MPSTTGGNIPLSWASVLSLEDPSRVVKFVRDGQGQSLWLVQSIGARLPVHGGDRRWRPLFSLGSRGFGTPGVPSVGRRRWWLNRHLSFVGVSRGCAVVALRTGIGGCRSVRASCRRRAGSPRSRVGSRARSRLRCRGGDLIGGELELECSEVVAELSGRADPDYRDDLGPVLLGSDPGDCDLR